MVANGDGLTPCLVKKDPARSVRSVRTREPGVELSELRVFLMVAAERMEMAKVMALLIAGAQPTTPDNAGKTALSRVSGRSDGASRQIAEMVFSLDGHFSAESLQEQFRQSGNPVAKATVYRTLQLLTDSGLVEALDFQTTPSRTVSSWRRCAL